MQHVVHNYIFRSFDGLLWTFLLGPRPRINLGCVGVRRKMSIIPLPIFVAFQVAFRFIYLQYSEAMRKLLVPVTRTLNGVEGAFKPMYEGVAQHLGRGQRERCRRRALSPQAKPGPGVVAAAQLLLRRPPLIWLFQRTGVGYRSMGPPAAERDDISF
jgi:hypothetical protein